MFNFFDSTFTSELLAVARHIQTSFDNISIRLDTTNTRLTQIMNSLDNLTAQVTKNSTDIDAALAAIANSGATPAQLDALTTAIAAKDALIETALNMPAPTPPVNLP